MSRGGYRISEREGCACTGRFSLFLKFWGPPNGGGWGPDPQDHPGPAPGLLAFGRSYLDTLWAKQGDFCWTEICCQNCYSGTCSLLYCCEFFLRNLDSHNKNSLDTC